MSKNNDSNVTVKGGIDAGWTSYFGDEESHGKTVDATEKGESGRETMNIIPKEADEENLTEIQRTVIEAAVLNPEESTRSLAEGISIDIHPSNIRGILRDEVPEWYEAKFKSQGRSTDMTFNTKEKEHNFARMEPKEALKKLGGQGTSDEIMKVMGQSKNTVHNKLNEMAEGGSLEAHFGVGGYHNRTKVFTLPDREPMPKNEIEEERESESSDFQKFDPNEESEEEKSNDLAELFGTDDEGEESIKENLQRQDAHDEIRTVCQYEAEGDGESAQLARYVLERL